MQLKGRILPEHREHGGGKCVLKMSTGWREIKLDDKSSIQQKNTENNAGILCKFI